MLEFLILKNASVSPVSKNKITRKTVQRLESMKYLYFIGEKCDEKESQYLITDDGLKRLQKLSDDINNLAIAIVSSIISAVTVFILGRIF